MFRFSDEARSSCEPDDYLGRSQMTLPLRIQFVSKWHSEIRDSEDKWIATVNTQHADIEAVKKAIEAQTAHSG
jgi:hypothetical protein